MQAIDNQNTSLNHYFNIDVRLFEFPHPEGLKNSIPDKTIYKYKFSWYSGEMLYFDRCPYILMEGRTTLRVEIWNNSFDVDF